MVGAGFSVSAAPEAASICRRSPGFNSRSGGVMRRLLLMIGVFLVLAPSAQAKLFAPGLGVECTGCGPPGARPKFSRHLPHPVADDSDPHGLGRHRCLLHPDLHGGTRPTPGAGPADLVAFRDLDGAPAAPGNPDSALRHASDRPDAHLTVWQPSKDRLWDLWGSGRRGASGRPRPAMPSSTFSVAGVLLDRNRGHRSRIRPGRRPRLRFRSRRGR